VSKLRPAIDSREHIRGSLDAPIQLVEFGDYECPFCGEVFPTVEALIETLGDRLCFAFRHFPIVGSHPHALSAAEAAEAAGAQGRFWEMHILLYQNQDALDFHSLQQHAVQLGLDLGRFTEDVRSQRHKDKIHADLHSGAVSGVNGTPSFFINGYRHDGAYDYDSLMAAIAASAGAEVGV
jgi:protein-disulfide isomerase